jgi:beta-galactosidase
MALTKTSPSLIPLSARHFSDADLYAVRHGSELIPAAETYITLDTVQRGLGTGSCGPQTLDEYVVQPGKDYQFAFSIIL